MHIHFICSGNTNRSRMAEAYFNSKNIPNWRASSSGIYAKRNENGPITYFAKKVLEQSDILDYASKNWQQTTKALLAEADVVVFMKQLHFDFVQNELGYTPEHYYVWSIEDVVPDGGDTSTARLQEEVIEDQGVFKTITKKIDELIPSLDQYEKN